jgi:hypothetical protein
MRLIGSATHRLFKKNLIGHPTTQDYRFACVVITLPFPRVSRPGESGHTLVNAESLTVCICFTRMYNVLGYVFF